MKNGWEYMFKIFSEKLDWHGLKLELETGKLARQADGAVISSLGGTKVYVLCVLRILTSHWISFHCQFITLKKLMLLEKYQVVFLKEKVDHLK